MKKRIYLKLVLIFVLTIFLGTALSIDLAYRLYFNKIYEGYIKDLTKTANDVVELYKTRDEDDFDKIINTNVFANYSIQIYKSNGEIKLYKNHKDSDKNNRKSSVIISEEAKETVQKGEIYLNHPKLKKVSNPKIPLVGYPFKIDKEGYALFIYPEFNGDFWEIHTIIRIIFFSIVLTGVVMFAIVGRMIVKRVNNLTIASRQIAKGNYNIKVKDKYKDEISELSRTFNIMADKLNKTEKMRQEFVSNVSHEIQSPITSIMGFASILQSDYLDNVDKKTYAKIIEDESRRMSKLGENLLKLASLDNDQNPINKEVYRLDEQLRRVVLGLEPKWSRKYIEFELELPNTKIYADKDLLDQVWINIIGNSIKFSNGKSEILIDIEENLEEVKVRIKDNGIGIKKEDLEKIFERFYQADESRKVEGSGLGLSITKKIIDLHHGKIDIKSELSVGTEFIVSLTK